MRSGQATPIPQGGNVSRRTLSTSLPALPSVPSDRFYDTGNHDSDDDAHGICWQGQLHAEDALYGAGGDENNNSRMESQELA